MRHILLVLTLWAAVACGWEEENTSYTPVIKGLNLVAAPGHPDSASFGAIQKTGANWVAVIPYAFLRPGETEIHFNTSGQWAGERKEGIILAVDQAHAIGLKVMLKPHVWVMGQGWMGDFTLSDEEKWQKWQEAYTRYLIFYADLSDSLGVEMLCIGTEMRQVVQERPAYWPELIDTVKDVYRGKLTYAANWDNYENVGFWNELDYIGIDAYFPLSDDPLPSAEELRNAWKPIAEHMANFAGSIGKQVIFTEYGYKSTTYTAAAHWEKRERIWEEQAQVAGLEGLYTTFWKGKHWFDGGFLWKWHPTAETMKRGEITEPYTVQNKRGLLTLKEWYGAEVMSE
ncbi:hypothetical protein AB9P05_23310 [Roseivirga sp. BDSF3-8]|uniref:glycoside hydrolase family 113 n=1 Tax=Roseivirga sp. BDSF3-8 TaxID=3241598 RepID=UPI0035327BAF